MNFLRKYDVYLAAVIGSILVALIILAWQQPIDTDGITYISSAQAFLSGGFAGAEAVYSWAYYASLLAIIKQTFGLSFIAASNLLNFVLDTLTVLFFVRILEYLGGSKRVLWFGLVIILFLPFFAHFRNMLMRGHGYYAFSFLALFFLIKYVENRKISNAFFYGGSLVVASLFRPEAAVFAVFVPLAVFFQKDLKFFAKIKSIFWLYISFVIVLVCAIFLAWYSSGHQVIAHGNKLGRIYTVVYEIKHGFLLGYKVTNAKAVLIKKYIIPDRSLFESAIFLLCGMIGYVLYSIFKGVNLLYFILGIVGLTIAFKNRDREKTKVVLAFLIVSLAVILVYFSQWFFLVRRYISLFSLFLILGVPFTLEILYLKWRERQGTIFGSRWFFPFILVWVVAIMLSSLIYFGPSKTYVINAGEWVQKNVPEQAALCNDNGQLGFYANAKNTILLGISGLNKEELQQCDYMAVTIDRNDPPLANEITALLKQPLIIFKNRRGSRVEIYKIDK